MPPSLPKAAILFIKPNWMFSWVSNPRRQSAGLLRAKYYLVGSQSCLPGASISWSKQPSCFRLVPVSLITETGKCVGFSLTLHWNLRSIQAQWWHWAFWGHQELSAVFSNHTGVCRRLVRLPSEPLASILSSVIKRVFSFFQSNMCK